MCFHNDFYACLRLGHWLFPKGEKAGRFLCQRHLLSIDFCVPANCQRCVTQRRNEKKKKQKIIQGKPNGECLVIQFKGHALPDISPLFWGTANSISHLPPSPPQSSASARTTDRTSCTVVDWHASGADWVRLTTPPPSVPHCVYIIYALACSISAQSPGSLCVSRKWLLLCRDPHTHSMFPQLLVGWLLTDKGGEERRSVLWHRTKRRVLDLGSILHWTTWPLSQRN